MPYSNRIFHKDLSAGYNFLNYFIILVWNICCTHLQYFSVELLPVLMYLNTLSQKSQSESIAFGNNYDDFANNYTSCDVCGENYPCLCLTDPLSSSCECCQNSLSYNMTEPRYRELIAWHHNNIGGLTERDCINGGAVLNKGRPVINNKKHLGNNLNLNEGLSDGRTLNEINQMKEERKRDESELATLRTITMYVFSFCEELYPCECQDLNKNELFGDMFVELYN